MSEANSCRGAEVERFKFTFIQIPTVVMMASGNIFMRGPFHGDNF